MRYRLLSGKDSKRTLGRAWNRRGRPPHGFLKHAVLRPSAGVGWRSLRASRGAYGAP
jgi:hypothetical protein